MDIAVLKAVKSIVEIILKNMDWELEPDELLPMVTGVLYQRINGVVNDVGVVAVVQCNDLNNAENTIEAGELHLGVLLVNASDLVTETLKVNSKIDGSIVSVEFEESW